MRVLTPEQVSLEFRLAGIGTRAVAHVLDLLVVFGSIAIVAAGLLLFQHYVGFGAAWSYVEGIGILLAFLAFWTYFIASEFFLSGKTIGKVVMRIRVIQFGGRPITFFSAVVRNLLRIVDFFPLCYLIAFISMLVDAHERRIGDLAAGTIVVIDYHSWTLDPQDDLVQAGAVEETCRETVIFAKHGPWQIVIATPLPDAWNLRLATYAARRKRMSRRAGEDIAEQLFRALTDLPDVQLSYTGDALTHPFTTQPLPYEKARLLVAIWRATGRNKKGVQTTSKR